MLCPEQTLWFSSHHSTCDSHFLAFWGSLWSIKSLMHSEESRMFLGWIMSSLQCKHVPRASQILWNASQISRSFHPSRFSSKRHVAVFSGSPAGKILPAGCWASEDLFWMRLLSKNLTLQQPNCFSWGASQGTQGPWRSNPRAWCQELGLVVSTDEMINQVTSHPILQSPSCFGGSSLAIGLGL